MHANNKLTHERACEMLNYDKDTGIFTWRVYRRGVQRGKPVGSYTTKGYILITIDGCTYRAHRIAWLIVNGSWPQDQIDHINGIRDDNRISNLREAKNPCNQENQRKARSDNKIGLLGVIWNKQCNKFQAHIVVKGKQRHLGYFLDANDAHSAYVSAKRLLHAGNTL